MNKIIFFIIFFAINSHALVITTSNSSNYKISILNDSNSKSNYLLPIKGQIIGYQNSILKDDCSLKQLMPKESCHIFLENNNFDRLFIQEYGKEKYFIKNFNTKKDSKLTPFHQIILESVGVGDLTTHLIPIDCGLNTPKISTNDEDISFKVSSFKDCILSIDISVNTEKSVNSKLFLKNKESTKVVSLIGSSLVRKPKTIQANLPSSIIFKNIYEPEVYVYYSTGNPSSVKLMPHEYDFKMDFSSLHFVYQNLKISYQKRIIELKNYPSLEVVKNKTLEGNVFYFNDLKISKNKTLTIKSKHDGPVFIQIKKFTNDGSLIVSGNNVVKVINYPNITGSLTGKIETPLKSGPFVMIQSIKNIGNGEIILSSPSCDEGYLRYFSNDSNKYQVTTSCGSGPNVKLLPWTVNEENNKENSYSNYLFGLLIIGLIIFTIGIRFSILIIFKSYFKQEQ